MCSTTRGWPRSRCAHRKMRATTTSTICLCSPPRKKRLTAATKSSSRLAHPRPPQKMKSNPGKNKAAVGQHSPTFATLMKRSNLVISPAADFILRDNPLPPPLPSCHYHLSLHHPHTRFHILDTYTRTRNHIDALGLNEWLFPVLRVYACVCTHTPIVLLAYHTFDLVLFPLSFFVLYTHTGSS